MNVAAKLVFAALVTLGLTSLSLWICQFVSATSESPWSLFLNSSFKELAGLAVILSLSVFFVYDVVSIFLFRFGFEKVNYEMDVYEGPEGAIPRKVSTTNKLVFYLCLLFSIQFIIVMMCKHSATGP